MNSKTSRHFKRVIAAAIVLTLVAGAAPVQNFAPLADVSITASAEVVGGTFNSTDSWSYDQETKVLTISGTGSLNLSGYYADMSNAGAYSAETVIIGEGFKYINSIPEFTLAKSISIPNTAVSISKEAFYEWRSLESVTLPDSVTSLGEDAFYGCTGLKSVHLSDNITTLQNGTFYNCTNLETVHLPENLTTIASGTYWNRRSAFGRCTSLKSIKLPGTLEAVTADTFSGCTALETVEIEDGVKNIWGSAFSGCTSLKSITIPGSVENVYSWAFNQCTSLATVKIEDGVKKIGYSAFNGCTALTSIEIPDSVETVDERAFKDCTALKTAVLPDGLKTISSSLFSGCEALETVNIPDGVTTIGYDAFEDCKSLKSVVIPNSVTEINSEAFENCESLESVTLSRNITELKAGVFKNCSSLTSIDIPSGTTSISSDGYGENGSFSGCTSLKTINFADTVTEIGGGAFSGCTALETLIIPDNVTELGKSAFADCTGLTSVTLSNNLTSLPLGLFENCTSLESIVIPNGVTTISDSSYENNGTFKGCTSLKSVSIPDSVTTIGASSFDGCIALKSVAIPANVTTIGYKAFADCSDLTSIDIPNSVEVIEDSAFENCTGIESVVIPASITDIEREAFNGCTNLKSVEFSGDDGIYFGYNAFGSLTEDVSVEIPKKSRGGMASVYSDDIYPDNNEGGNADPGSYFGKAKVSFKGGNVTYTKVEAVEPTCTKNGSYEYYIGSDGNYYQDAYGFDKYDSLEDTVWSAYGHSEKVAWSWTKLSSGDYKAVAKFSCKRGDLDTTYVTATVTSEESDEGTTYHAVAVCPLDEDMYYWHTSGHEVTYDYFVESAKYTVTVEGGSVTAATKKDEYKSGDSVTVKADKEKDGAYFTGWYIGDKCVSTNPSYTFFVKEDTTITAKYEEQEKEQAAVVSLTLTREGDSYYYSKQKIKYSYGWSLPEGSKLVEAGVLRAYDTDITDVTPDTAKENGVTQNKSSLKTVNGTYNLTVNMSYETKRKTVYSKGYVIYTDAKGNTHTQMTDMQTSAYEN